MKILIASDVAKEAVELLGTHFDVDVVTGLEGEALAEKLVPYDAVVIRSKPKLTRQVLEKATSLKLVARAGVGLDNIDLEYCKEKDIKVVNSPAALSESVAELVFALLLSFERNIVRADNSLKDGLWIKKELKGMELFGKTIGIIGFGRIGSHIASIAKGFGMRVIGYDVHWNEELAKSQGVEFWPVDILLQEADYVTVHVPLLPQTRGLISKKELGTMKDSAVIVNTARGGIIDENDLYEALASKMIRGACIDVYEQEPPTDSPLLSLDNILLTPHIGASTHEAQVKAGTIIAQKIIEEMG